MNGLGGVAGGMIGKMDSRMSYDRRRRHRECCGEGKEKKCVRGQVCGIAWLGA